jgi:nucleoside-diphosphate-sugar epimerase
MKVKNVSNKLFSADLTTKKGVESIFTRNVKYDVIINAAAVTSGAKDITERPYIHVTDNVIINALSLQACYDYGVNHYIFLSCGVAYPPSDTSLKEKDMDLNLTLQKPYFGVGWTKLYTEKLCEFYSGLGVKCTVIRHSNTIGPFDKYNSDKSHFFAANITKVMKAKDNDVIIVWGEGKELRDLIYVDDVIAFIKLKINESIDDNIFDIINISHGQSYSVNYIVDKIINISGKNLKRENYISKPSIPINISMSNEYAQKKYSWKPNISLGESIRKCMTFYDSL